MFYKQPKLFQDPHIHYPIDNPNLSFTDYIELNKKIIAEHRADLQEHPELTIDANAPFELRPPPQKSTKIKYGALLIHGLLDSCFVMKDIGTHLQSQGLLVRSILLPGHGTVPGSLLNITYEDWLQAVRYGIASLANEVESIFLVGYSTGASLSVYHALQHPEKIAGLILLAPAFKINSYFDFATNWHRPISRAWPRAGWFNITKEIDYTKYCSMPFNAAYQVYRLTQAIKKIDHTKEPACPVFIALSFDDRVVSSLTTLKYFRDYTNEKNKLVLYAQKQPVFNDPRIQTKSAIYPKWHIESFSHISLPIAPDNFHYGIKGDYPLASHVEEDNHFVYCALDKPLKTYWDLLYQYKLVSYQKQRLTLNPDFAGMMHEIMTFIRAI